MQSFHTEPVFIAYNVAHRCWHKYSLCMFIKADFRLCSLLFSVLIICPILFVYFCNFESIVTLYFTGRKGILQIPDNSKVIKTDSINQSGAHILKVGREVKECEDFPFCAMEIYGVKLDLEFDGTSAEVVDLNKLYLMYFSYNKYSYNNGLKYSDTKSDRIIEIHSFMGLHKFNLDLYNRLRAEKLYKIDEGVKDEIRIVRVW